VFNQKLEVVGILIAGSPDPSLVVDKAKNCQRYNQCSENGSGCLAPDTTLPNTGGYQGIGSEVQRISPVIKLIQELHRHPNG
jgi:hypothetical protein